MAMKLNRNPYKISIILGLILFVPLLVMITSHFFSRHQARSDLHEANQLVFTEWFGINETSYQYILIWKDNGLVGLGILDEEQANTILGSRAFNGFSEAEQEDIKALLTGGTSILDESDFSAERFLIAISDIDMILRIDIQSDWNSLIRGN